MTAYLYILANRLGGTLYTGSTTQLYQRLGQHRANVPGSFTAKYGVHRLVYVESDEDIRDAQRREAQVKKWKRAWKIELIEEMNSDWKDLSQDVIG